MPFKSEKQRRYMHANLPELAKRWERDYASGGIARIPLQVGGLPLNPVGGLDQFSKEIQNLERGAYPIGGTPYRIDQLGGSVQDYYQNRIPTKWGQGMGGWKKMRATQPLNMYSDPTGENIYGMDEMFAYPGMQQNNMISNMERMKPLALDIMTGKYKYGVGPDGKPYQQPRTIADQNRVLGQTFTEQQPAWYNRMFNKARQGITGLKNKFTGAYDTSQNFVKNIMDNTMIGRVAAGFDATNPRAFNYNPALQGQIDFMKAQKKYGTNPTSGLNQITGGILAGKNLQSMFGSNDLGAMYEKSIAQTEKTLAGLLEEDEEGNNIGSWSNLAKTNPAAFAKKVAIHKARLQNKQNEYNTFKANQEKIRQENIAKEKAAAKSFVQQNPNYGDAGANLNPGSGGGKGYDPQHDYSGTSTRDRHDRASDLGFSDIRLKENVELIGNSPSNINIYKFNYLNDPTVYQGVMAQDVPWATVKADNGYLMVDYNKVDVEFKKWPK